MIKSIAIENFKCFGESVTIPFAPLTLIYGQNSAGKSTIIQALQVLKYCTTKLAFSFPLNELVRFRDFVYERDEERTMTLGIAGRKELVTTVSWKKEKFLSFDDPRSSMIGNYLSDNLVDELGPMRGNGRSDSSRTMDDFDVCANRMSKRSDLIGVLNKDMSDLKIPYKLVLEEVSGLPLPLFVPTTEDEQKSDALMFHRSMVGFGIGQIVPVLVSCRYHKNKTITIQQPELHVHPAMQAEMGSFFADVIHEQKNQLLIETHSEHLLLRVQRLVRKGELLPSEVSLLFVEQGPRGAQVRCIALNDAGALSAWPQGFMADRAEEVYGD